MSFLFFVPFLENEWGKTNEIESAISFSSKVNFWGVVETDVR